MQSLGDKWRSGDAWLRVRDQGAGAPIVFIHGWTLDLDSWEPQAAAFAGSHRVVRYDRRGFGLSEGLPGRAADAEDLGRLVDQLGPGAVTLVGVSQGARVALAMRSATRSAFRRWSWTVRRTKSAIPRTRATRTSRSSSTAASLRSRAWTRSGAPGAGTR